MIASLFRRTLYQPLMRMARYFNWHYAPPLYPDGDTLLWCKWCGFRQQIKSKYGATHIRGDIESKT